MQRKGALKHGSAQAQENETNWERAHFYQNFDFSQIDLHEKSALHYLKQNSLQLKF